jgi:2-dehydropantoate 2-reductase
VKIAVIGAGGGGGCLGARLTAAGNDVTFVARSGAHLNALRERGLTVHSPGGDLHIHPAQVVDHIEQLSQPEIILIAVKCRGRGLAIAACPANLVPV